MSQTNTINSIIFNMTDTCNLQCDYCFVAQNKQNITLEIMQKACQLIPETVMYPVIIFFGGEPTLCHDLIVEFIEWTKVQYPNRHFCFSMTTNGTLLTEEKLMYYYNNKIQLLLSLDGDDIMQNTHRHNTIVSNTFDLIPLAQILQYYPNIHIRSTITPITVKNLFEHSYCFFKAININSVHYGLAPNYDWTQEDLDIYSKNMLAIAYCQFVDICQHNNVTKCNNIDQTLKTLTAAQLDYKFNKYQRCGLGVQSIGVATDGKIFGCHDFNYTHDSTHPFYLGNVYTGIDNEKSEKLKDFADEIAKTIANNEYCQNCALFEICKHKMCLADYANKYKLHGLDTPSKLFCQEHKILYIIVESLLNEFNNKELYDYTKELITPHGTM